ncbi:MAG: histidine kinase [Marinilabiliaceae bacterium]|nr:histidine kinase [Marinilabiliaceae bacterium]
MSSSNHLLKTTSRIALHILFWFICIIAFTHIFDITDPVSKIDFLFSGLFHISIVSGVYLNLLILIPTLFNKKKYLYYSLFFSLTLFMTAYFNQITFDWLADLFFPDYYFVSQFNRTEIGILVFIYFSGTSVIKLSKSWFELQEANHQISKIEKENINSQLKALKSQINPHFLFNSLNVLYSLTLKESKETPEAIIKLSDILRYVIYDSNNDLVELNDEVKLLNNYINLQKHRIDKSSKITFQTDIQNKVKIAPMLLLPLVENSFKHGIKGDITDTYVTILLTTNAQETCFEIENNKGISDNPTPNSNGGIGLANIKQRLDLLYPEQHTFTVSETENKFKVTLKLNHEN